MSTAATARRAAPLLAAWQWGFLLLAALTLLPAAYFTYQDTQEAGRAQRVQLIERYRLWETAPEYRGTPQSWTRSIDCGQSSRNSTTGFARTANCSSKSLPISMASWFDFCTLGGQGHRVF